jgi:hypothetical protein
MLRILFFCAFLIVCFTSNAQLINESKNQSRFSFNQKNTLYLGIDAYSSFRELYSNTAFLSTPLGEREYEAPRWMTSYSLRVEIPLFRIFKINSGLSFQQNGESYNWNSVNTDSSFAYQTSFKYIGMPIQLSIEYGNKISIYGALGVSPAIFNSYLQKSQWTNELGSSDSEETSIQDNCSSFIISFRGNLGIHYHINDHFGVQLSALYRRQLNNTYKEYEDYIHKAYSIGFNLSTSYQF